MVIVEPTHVDTLPSNVVDLASDEAAVFLVGGIERGGLYAAGGAFCDTGVVALSAAPDLCNRSVVAVSPYAAVTHDGCVFVYGTDIGTAGGGFAIWPRKVDTYGEALCVGGGVVVA